MSYKNIKFFYIFGLIFGFHVTIQTFNDLIVKKVDYKNSAEHENIYNFIYSRKAFWGNKNEFFSALQTPQKNGIKCFCISKINGQILGYMSLAELKNYSKNKNCLNLYMENLTIDVSIDDEHKKSQIINTMLNYIKENYKAKSVKKICLEVNKDHKLLIKNLYSCGFAKPWLKNCNFNFYCDFLEKS